MKLLFATPEIQPIAKTGGLGDVSRSLPLALQHASLDIRILLPGYRSVLAGVPRMQVLGSLDSLGWFPSAARLLEGKLPGSELTLWIVDCPELFDRPGTPYQDPAGKDWEDNPLRFGLLCRVGALLCGPGSPLGWRPDLVHCNDWQTALIPAFLRYGPEPFFPSVQTIHNLAFQGNFDPAWVGRLGLPSEGFHMHGLEFYGRLSFLKAGINYAHKITTVSRRYALEIQTPEFGCGLEGLLRFRNRDLTGIINGIDEEWNPDTDADLPAAYNATRLAEGKARNKRALQQEFGLKSKPELPLLGIVSRLTHQKGIDLLLDGLEALMSHPLQLVVLGSGDSRIEQRLQELADIHSGNMRVSLGFDEPLSHRIIAGSDLFLMPSRFEPCGLAQMYAMTYGTVPVVRRTGGLADTVTDYAANAQADGTATGFVFDEATPDQLGTAILRALEVFPQKRAWRILQKNGMRRDFSWGKAASEYLEIYRSLLKARS